MPSTTLKILREINDFTQEYIALDVLGISQTTYARIEQAPEKLSGEQAKKLAALYKVDINDLLGESQPKIVFRERDLKDRNEKDFIAMLQHQNDYLMQQNKELIEVVKVLGGKVGRRLYAG